MEQVKVLLLRGGCRIWFSCKTLWKRTCCILNSSTNGRYLEVVERKAEREGVILLRGERGWVSRLSYFWSRHPLISIWISTIILSFNLLLQPHVHWGKQCGLKIFPLGDLWHPPLSCFLTDGGINMVIWFAEICCQTVSAGHNMSVCFNSNLLLVICLKTS